MIKIKLKAFAAVVIIFYCLPTVIYGITSFQYVGDFSMKTARTNYLEYKTKLKKDKLDKKIINYHNFKYIFYFKNYSNYENYLKKYKGLSLRKFQEQFHANE